MANITSVLNEQIRRMARREIGSETRIVRKASARHRREIAALKRQVANLMRRLAGLERQASRQAPQASAELPENVRYSPRMVKAQRARLGISAKEFGQLVGVAPLTVYHWESGKARPRQQQLARLVAIRGIGKREVLRRLEAEGITPKTSKRTRGNYGQTAEEMIRALVKSGKARTSGQINAAWRAAGRPGKADNTLSRMVAAGALKRVKLKGARGSEYSAK